MMDREADFADELGPAYLNLVMRRLGQRLSTEGDRYFGRQQLSIPARATSTMAYLAHHDHVSIAVIAEALGYSHQAVTKAVDQLEEAGLVVSGAVAEDRRIRRISVTAKGFAEIEKLDAMLDRIHKAFEQIFDETGVDLFRAVRQFERALESRSLVDRLVDAERQADAAS